MLVVIEAVCEGCSVVNVEEGRALGSVDTTVVLIPSVDEVLSQAVDDWTEEHIISKYLREGIMNIPGTHLVLSHMQEQADETRAITELVHLVAYEGSPAVSVTVDLTNTEQNCKPLWC